MITNFEMPEINYYKNYVKFRLPKTRCALRIFETLKTIKKEVESDSSTLLLYYYPIIMFSLFTCFIKIFSGFIAQDIYVDGYLRLVQRVVENQYFPNSQ